MNKFYFARFAPDKFGKKGAVHSWAQVVLKQGSDETVELDFLTSLEAARGIAIQRNCRL
jgi:hypothetical protein